MSRDVRPDLAIFDLCDTLFDTNTTFAFLEYYAATRPAPVLGKTIKRWTSRSSPFFYAGAIIERMSHTDIARSRSVGALAGESRDSLAQAATGFSVDYLPPHANQSLMRRLAGHKEAGDEALIVSSSLDLIVAPIASHLGVEFVASTLGFHGTRCTGQIERDLTGSKLSVLRERGLLDNRSIHVYTDNRSDAELLRAAHHPNIVLPRNRAKHRWGDKNCEYIEL
jgi:HAD superfamily phosphoserine phosphatase-like hydrolase